MKFLNSRVQKIAPMEVQWIPLSEDSFKVISREGTKFSENVLAMNSHGAMFVGRLSTSRDEFGNMKYYKCTDHRFQELSNIVAYIKQDKLFPKEITIKPHTSNSESLKLSYK